jgi:queuine tRNA-ribosyltransferase
MYKILKTDGRAKRAEFTTVHGTVQTPVFMNVGTVAAIKGAVATTDLQQIGTQIELSNTYHLHVRPGDKIIKQLGGLHKFMNWNKPILTDSGGFQVFSLAGLRKIKEEGVTFQSHIDGHKIFMGCRYSLILVQQSQWHLTNVRRQRLTESISRILLTEHTAG